MKMEKKTYLWHCVRTEVSQRYTCSNDFPRYDLFDFNCKRDIQAHSQGNWVGASINVMFVYSLRL